VSTLEPKFRLIEERLPQLRRFASLVTNAERADADECVADALRACMATTDDAWSAETTYYSVLRHIVQCARRREANAPSNAVETLRTAPFAMKFHNLSAAQRSALTLIVVEGLSYDTAAWVTELNACDVRHLVASARSRIGLDRIPMPLAPSGT